MSWQMPVLTCPMVSENFIVTSEGIRLIQNVDSWQNLTALCTYS
jgi:hypothetical protein